MHQEDIWNLTDRELIDELGAISSLNDRTARMHEREALRRILAKLCNLPDHAPLGPEKPEADHRD